MSSPISDATPEGGARLRKLPADGRALTFVRRLWTPGGVTALSIAVASALFFWGAWQRRWIADDGLIVLRTVRNLLAGNGPVFNMGERVEVNTSAAWTYVVWFFSWLTRAQMEYVVLGVTLVLSTLAIVFVMLGSGRLHRSRDLTTGAAASRMVLLPAGVLVYIALPPARDFATSGLETSLVICWLGLVFWLLMRWATTAAPSRAQVLTLGFILGLCWLVRPETVIVGAAILLMLFCVKQDWRSRVWLVAVSGLVPVGYQIWRMGYYGLPFPNTAVAKDATEAKWAIGVRYLGDLAGPYVMWVPLVLLLILAAVLLVGSRSGAEAVARYQPPASLQTRWAGFQRWLHSPSAAVTATLAVGLVWFVYELRVGGDFMHGRVLLPVVFLLMSPLAMIPIRLPTRAQWRSPALAPAGPRALALVSLAAWAGVILWALSIVNIASDARPGTISRDGIVDERSFYVTHTGNPHPLTAEDYLAYPRIQAMADAIRRTPEGGLVMPSGAMDNWAVIPPLGPLPEGGAGHIVYFINLGMPSMNTDLETKVYDQMGLAYPLAAHSPRLEHGRIGHDKNLAVDWVVADRGLVDKHEWGLPGWIDEDWVAEAQVAVTCEGTQELLASYQDDLTLRRFLSNIKNAWANSKYEIDNIPEYEIERCNLVAPELQNPR